MPETRDYALGFGIVRQNSQQHDCLYHITAIDVLKEAGVLKRLPFDAEMSFVHGLLWVDLSLKLDFQCIMRKVNPGRTGNAQLLIL